MSKIVQLKKQNEYIYPRTLDKAVLVSGTTTLDEYLNDLNTIIEEDELVISNALNDLNTRVSDTYTISETDSMISGFFDGANYDSNTKKIYFTHSGATKAEIDATDFIKDGMVDNVVVSGSNLVITFNTDAGKEDISIPLSSIFDPELYYTSAQTDILLDEKQDVLIAGTGITISGNVISSTVEVPQSLRIMGLTPSGHTLADDIDDYYTDELNEGEVGAWFITYSDGNILIPPQTETDAQGRVKLSDDWYSTLNYAGATWANVGDILLVYELAEGFAAYKILTLNEAGETRVGIMSPNDKIKVNQIDYKLPYSTDSVYAGGVTDGAYTNVTTGRSNWIDTSAAGSMVSLGNLQFAVDPSGRLYSRNKNLKNGTWNITEQLMTIGGRDVNTIYEPSVVGYGVCPNAPTTNPVTVYTFASADLDGNGYRSLLQIVTDRTTSEQYIRTAFYKPENGDFTYTNWVKITGYDDFEELRNIVIDNEYVTATALNALDEKFKDLDRRKQNTLTAGDGIEISGTTISCTVDTALTTEDVTARVGGRGDDAYYETLDKFDIHLLDFDHGFFGSIKQKDCESEIDWDDSGQTNTVDFIEGLINSTAPNIAPEDGITYVVAPYILDFRYIDENGIENGFTLVRCMVDLWSNGDDSYGFYLYIFNDLFTLGVEGEYSIDNNYALVDNYCASSFESILGDVDDKIEELYSVIEEDELITSTALNNLNSRLTNEYYTSAQTDTKIDSAYTTLYDIIVDDELAISSSLNDLNSRVDNMYDKDEVDLMFEDYYTSAETEDLIDELSGMKEVTYSALVALRNASGLTPGATYKITDYVTTTTQENTQSAGHVFDVIVTADTDHDLNENARAAMHGITDIYFGPLDININAWEIKYCLDNDSSRFHWADSGNGKGVIYYMKDEYGNECPYDFKNIQFKRWAISGVTGDGVPSGIEDNLDETLVYNSNSQPVLYSFTDTDIQVGKVTFGVNASAFDYYYTFTWINELGQILDSSNYGNHYQTEGEYVVGCYENHIGATTENDFTAETYSDNSLAFMLSNNVFVSNYNIGAPSVYSNHLGNACYNNTFCGYVSDNIFGDYTCRNIFGNSIFGNKFGNDVNDNVFCMTLEDDVFGNAIFQNVSAFDVTHNVVGNSISENIFSMFTYNMLGNSVHSNLFQEVVGNVFGNDIANNVCEEEMFNNVFGNDISGNTFGSSTNKNMFGNNIYENTFGDNFEFNTLGNNVSGNTFGDAASLNSFGNSISGNTFGDNFTSNTFGNKIAGIQIGINARSNTFGDECGPSIIGQNFQYNNLSNGCKYNTFGNGCKYNTLGNNCLYNTVSGNSESNTFMNSSSYNNLGTYCKKNTFGNETTYIILNKNYTENVIVENGNSHITLTSSGTTSSINPLRNVTISQGVNHGTAAVDMKTISHDTLNDAFKTVYAKDSLGNIIGYNPADVQKVIAEALTDLDERLKSLEQSSVSYQ